MKDLLDLIKRIEFQAKDVHYKTTIIDFASTKIEFKGIKVPYEEQYFSNEMKECVYQKQFDWNKNSIVRFKFVIFVPLI